MQFRTTSVQDDPTRRRTTVQLLASLLDADSRWTARELAAEVLSMSQNCALHSARHSGSVQTWSALATPWNFRDAAMASLFSRTVLLGPVPKGRWRRCWTNRRYGRNLGSLIRTKLEKLIKWMKASRFSSSNESALYTMCCECDVHCGVRHWWGNTAPRCTSKAEGKRYIQLQVPAPPSSSAQEKTTALSVVRVEAHHSSLQCNLQVACV